MWEWTARSTFDSLEGSSPAIPEHLAEPVSDGSKALTEMDLTLVWGVVASLVAAFLTLQFTIFNYPQRPTTNPALLDRIEKLETMAQEAVTELGQQKGLWGLSEDTTIGIGTNLGIRTTERSTLRAGLLRDSSACASSRPHREDHMRIPLTDTSRA